MEPWDDVKVQDIYLEGIGIEAYISKVSIHLLLHVGQVTLGYLPRNHLSVSKLLVLLLFPHLSLQLLEIGEFLLFSSLHSLDISSLSRQHPIVVILLLLHLSELLFLQDFHPGDLEGLTAEHREDRLDLIVKQEELVVFNEGLLVHTLLLRHEPGGLRALDLDLSLAADFVARGFVSELLNELISLDIDVLPTLERFRGPDITSEELLSGCSSGLSLGLGSLLTVIEDLILVVVVWNDHGCISASSEHSLVVHYILRIVLPTRYC